MNTLVDCPDTLTIALQVARGDYQRSLVLGHARWSGADLRGTANKYGGRYAASRRALTRRLKAAGLEVERLRIERKIVVLIADTRTTPTFGPIPGVDERLVIDYDASNGAPLCLAFGHYTRGGHTRISVLTVDGGAT